MQVARGASARFTGGTGVWMTGFDRGVGRGLPLAMLSLGLVLVAGCSSAATPAAVDTTTALTPALELAREVAIDPDLDLEDLCATAFRDVEPIAGLRVGLLTTSGSIDDGTFNQFAYEGMLAAGRCFGLETTYVASGSEGDEHDQLRDLVAQGVDAIVSVGFALGAATADVAVEAPDVAFIGLDQSVDDAPTNLSTVTFRDDQAGFLAGTLAGALTRTGTVAVIAGPDVPPVVALADGFEAGVAAAAPEVTVLRTHLGSFSDPAAGRGQARSALSQGADVVYAPAGLTGAGAIVEAASQGRWVIGVDQDQYLTTFEGGRGPGADRIASSTVKRVDLGVFVPLADLARGIFRGGAVQLDVASGGVTYAPPRTTAIPGEVVDELERVRVALADGSLEPLGP
jgi:basic membrane protein A and related proteins